MSRPSRPRRGFSLVELLVSLVVASIVVAGSLFLLVSQQKTFQGGTADRAMQEAGRVALERISSDLRMGAYGMDPGMAFDFGPATVPMDRAKLAPGVTSVPFGGFACNAPVTCRDRVDGPDELVIHSRDPAFGHLVLAASESEVTLQGPLNVPLHAGQLLQLVCYSGSGYWAYVTVGQEVPANAGDVTVTLRPSTGDPHAFGGQNADLTDTCFSAGARAFKINRSRFYVETYDDAGVIRPWGTPGAHPYLMLDQGLSDATGAPQVEVLAPDVEDLQVAYVFPLAPAGTQLRGATVGTLLQDDPAGIDLAPATVPPVPLYTTAARDVVRTTGHPANIRAVRVGVIVGQREPNAGAGDATLPALGNRDAVARPRDRRFTAFETTVAIPNMESRGPFSPAWGDATSPSDAGQNFGGG